MTAASKEENTAAAPSHNPSETDDAESNTEIDIQSIILDYSSEEDEELVKPSFSAPTPKKNCETLRERLRSSASIVRAEYFRKTRSPPTTEKTLREKFVIRAARDKKLARHKEREFGGSSPVPMERKRCGPPPAESQPWFSALTEQQKEYYRACERFRRSWGCDWLAESDEN